MPPFFLTIFIKDEINDYNMLMSVISSDHGDKMPTTEDLERAERLHKVIEALCEVNKRFPVVVEGKKDLQALRKLGLSGDIIPLHSGKGLYEFSEELAERFAKVVLLLDWDAKGETLFTSLTDNLNGHWEEYAAFRELLRMLCQKDIKDIESIPTLLLRLEGSD
jgi:5S rRNA maturation endonuclease (ribonuclease M5)